MKAATEERKRPFGQVSLYGPRQRQKTSVWTSKPVWVTLVKRKCPYEQVGLCRPRQKLESVCVDDEKACVGYVSEKKMSVWTSWPV